MKRACAALVATVAGMVLLLGFKTHSARQLVQTPPAVTSSSPPTPQAPAAAGAAPSVTAAPAQPRTVTGSSISTRYGDVQVRVTFAGSQITDVVPLRLPDSNGVDQQIDQVVVPILIQETLAAQGANIQAVSGATYTSDGYVRSLQSALDRAK